MCYHLSAKSTIEELEKRFEAQYAESEAPLTYHHVSAFSFPKIPVIAQDEPNKIKLYNWGLIPTWVKDKTKADELKAQTLNARSETMFEKASFRSAIVKRRCMVLVNGFYEWRDYNGKKYPYYIHLKDGQPFAMGGMTESWTDKETGEVINSFTIVTQAANPLMAQIHNTKLRMPLILPRETERLWIDPMADKAFIESLVKQYPDSEMAAHTISKLITSRKESSNQPKVTELEVYAELPNL
jgi:putative SOS response-associated peptidase YedK